MATYPAGLYAGTTVTDNVTDVLATHHNTQEAELTAIETELGTDVAGTATDLKTRLAHSINDGGYLEFDAASELTIASGAITVTQNFHFVDTESDDPTDNLDTINGESAGLFLVLRTAADARDVTIRHNVGNIYCAGAVNITLDATYQLAILIYDGSLSKWLAFEGQASSSVSGAGADSYVAVWTGSDTIEGTDDLQWNGTTFTIGDGTAGRDYIITINGETNDCVITWMEDEDYLKVGDGLLMDTAEEIFFRDTAIHIKSADDGHLDLTADTTIDLNGVTLATDKINFTQTDGNENIDSQADGYMDYTATTAHRFRAAAADTDVALQFVGTTNSGAYTWMEDEDYLQASDGILMATTEEIFFRDTAVHVESADDGHLDLTADVSIDLNGDTVAHGDVWFGTSGAGLPYGTFYGNEIAWQQASAAQNTWYEITDSDIATGPVNLITFGSNGRLTATKAGNYVVNWAVTSSVSTAGKHVQVGIGVSGTVGNAGIQHYDLNLANSEIPVAGTAIITLTAAQYISIWIRTTDTGTPNLDVDHINVSMFMVGL